jgi:hypothetical protein
VNFVPVPVHEVDRIWPQVAEGFERAVRRSTGDMNLAWLYQQCRTGQLFLLVVIQEQEIIGAFILRPVQGKKETKAHIVEMWGRDFRHWLDEATRAVLDFSKRAFGADAVVFEGQRAHVRFVPRARELRRIYEVR